MLTERRKINTLRKKKTHTEHTRVFQLPHHGQSYNSERKKRRTTTTKQVCSMLQYDTDICCFAFMNILIFLLNLSIPFLSFFFFFRSGIDKLMAGFMILVCPT